MLNPGLLSSYIKSIVLRQNYHDYCPTSKLLMALGPFVKYFEEVSNYSA